MRRHLSTSVAAAWRSSPLRSTSQAWLDGDLVLSKDNIRYRYDSDFLISRAYLTTYAGGSDEELFAPSKDQYIWFDDFAVRSPARHSYSCA